MALIKKLPPYSFILEELGDIVTGIKPMFGAYGIYRDHQILMILRKKEKFDNDTGIWLGVVNGHQESLKKEIPELRDLEMFGPGPTAWQVVGEEIANFEEVALQICELIKRKDSRIGRTPKTRLKTKKVAKSKVPSEAEKKPKKTKALPGKARKKPNGPAKKPKKIK